MLLLSPAAVWQYSLKGLCSEVFLAESDEEQKKYRRERTHIVSLHVVYAFSINKRGEFSLLVYLNV